MICYTCDALLGERDNKFLLHNGRSSAPNNFECENCAELRFELYMEGMVF